jgi:hypothetical protein
LSNIFDLLRIVVSETPGRIEDVEDALQRFPAVREDAATGKWTNWHRGDDQVNAPAFLEITRAVKQKPLALKGDENPPNRSRGQVAGPAGNFSKKKGNCRPDLRPFLNGVVGALFSEPGKSCAHLRANNGSTAKGASSPCALGNLN